MNRYSWKVIVIGAVIEMVLLAGSVAIGVHIGKNLALEEQRTARQENSNNRQPETRATQDAPMVESAPSRVDTRQPQNTYEQERGNSPAPRTANTNAVTSSATGQANTNKAASPETRQSVNDAASPSVGLGNLPTSYLVIAGSLALVILILTLYFLVIVPRKKRRPMLDAFALINGNNPADFSEAEQLLGVALTNGMRAKEIDDARFALAYVRARLGRFSDAAAVLADLTASGRREPEIIYLDLWLQSQLKDDEKVIRTYEQHATRVRDMLDAKLIAGIAYLHRAQLQWTHREIASALHYFEELRKLRVLTEEIPSHVDDHEVLIGLMSLFDKNIDEARKHFAGAVTSAQTNSKPTTYGDLGLLLCTWCATDNPYIDDELGLVLKELTTGRQKEVESVSTACKFCDKRYTVRRNYAGQPVSCTQCKRRFIVELPKPDDVAQQNGKESELEHEALLNDNDLLLRNVLLWHVIARLFTWRSLPAQGGLPEAEHEVLSERLAKVREIDPEMPDPDLLAGLIAYYFASNEQAREEAVEILDNSMTNGVNIPEVLDLVAREKRLTELQRDSLNRYFVLARNYVTDKGRQEHLRRRLKELLERFSRFKQLDETELVQSDADAMPSVTDVQSRSQLLCKRVVDIVKPRLVNAETDDREAIETSMKRLNRTTKVLARKVTTLEEMEYVLMETTAEFLLREDEDSEQSSSESIDIGEIVNAEESEQNGAAGKAGAH